MTYLLWWFMFRIIYAQPANLVKNFSFETLNTDGTATNWSAQYGGYGVVTLSGAWDGTHVLALMQSASPTQMLGAVQRVTLNQTTAKPLRVSARVKAVSIADVSTDKYGASLYCRVMHTDGSMDYCPTTLKTKQVGTSADWSEVGFNSATFVNGSKPVTWIEVIPMMGQVTGTAYFDAVRVEEHEIHNTGAVTFMFDDGFATHHSEALPVLNSWGLHGSAAIVTSYVGTSSYMTLSNVQDLVANGWEIVSHSVHHQDMTTLSPVAMEDEYYFARQWFQQNGFGSPKHFALPFGAYNGLVIRTGQIYHQTIRTTDRGFNSPGVYPYNVWIQEVDSNITTQQVQDWLDTATRNHEWLILLFHEIKTADQMPAGAIYYTTPNTFETIVNMVVSNSKFGLPVMTYDQAFTWFNN